MKKYVFLYVGLGDGGEGAMKAWHDWFESVGEKFVDSGNPFGAGREVSANGSSDLALDNSAITGYSIVNVDSLEEAEALAKGCPTVPSVRVYEALPM